MVVEQYDAIGLIEVKYFTLASQLLDAMCKGSEVVFVSSENDLGGRLVTLVIGGTIENVQAALDIAVTISSQFDGHYLMNTVLISQPSDEIMNYLGEERKKKEDTNNE
ncbi:BMC domain-containing protein [Alkalicoccus daliensis]|uniref:BMC domain-containing protein n=1 Tax=Alkalicoccus daliensis TaxID=745820 RepID=A0A1H0HCB9_9BACI|nr:BMC domain-containing protein [Alkalicoccus daliensis]SDO16768.1 BMC domain-containing protein [Alkalicoccus daliensis]